jgi:hypothetical protein
MGPHLVLTTTAETQLALLKHQCVFFSLSSSQRTVWSCRKVLSFSSSSHPSWSSSKKSLPTTTLYCRPPTTQRPDTPTPSIILYSYTCCDPTHWLMVNTMLP